MQLRRLEAQLEVTLLRREGRRLALTGDGMRLLGHARRLLVLNDGAWTDLRAHPVTGVVRLGIPDDYASFLPPVLSYFGQLYPAVVLEVHCGLSVELVDQMRAGELDLAVVTRSMITPDLRALGAESGLPALPAVEIAIHRPPGRPPEPARQLTGLIQEQLAEA